jgi:hypothetical protein
MQQVPHATGDALTGAPLGELLQLREACLVMAHYRGFDRGVVRSMAACIEQAPW